MISWVSLRVSSADARPRRHHRRPAMQDPAHHFILIQHAEVRSLNRASEYTTFQGSDQRAHACAGVLGSKCAATHMNENSGSDLLFWKRSSHLNQHCQIHCSRVGTLATGVDSTRPASLDCWPTHPIHMPVPTAYAAGPTNNNDRTETSSSGFIKRVKSRPPVFSTIVH
jgi:hypothetical protein